MNIVAYVPLDEYALRNQISKAVGTDANGKALRVVFRDPALFQTCDADVLDTVVYVGAETPPEGQRNGWQQAQQARQIREAYAAFPGTHVLTLGDDGEMPGLPPEVQPFRPNAPAPDHAESSDTADMPQDVEAPQGADTAQAAGTAQPPVESAGAMKRREQQRQAEETKRQAAQPQADQDQQPTPGQRLP